MNAPQIPDGLLRLGFPENKARVAWERSNRDANRAAEFLLTNGHQPDSFWQQQPAQAGLALGLRRGG